jgi:hypothetical protein
MSETVTLMASTPLTKVCAEVEEKEIAMKSKQTAMRPSCRIWSERFTEFLSVLLVSG